MFVVVLNDELIHIPVRGISLRSKKIKDFPNPMGSSQSVRCYIQQKAQDNSCAFCW